MTGPRSRSPGSRTRGSTPSTRAGIDRWLEGEANPTNLLIRDRDVLVADYADYRIRRFDLAGEPLPDFGDQAFATALKEGLELRKEATLARLRWVVACVAVLMVAVLWGAWSSRKRLEVIARTHPQASAAPE